MGGGVVRVTEELSVAEQFGGETPPPNTIAVLADRRGRLWVGANGSPALFMAEQGGPLAKIASDLNTPHPPEPEIWPLREDARGRIVFGSFGPRGGVHRYDPSNGRYWGLTYDPESSGAGLTSGSVLSVLPDVDGSILVGTQGGGLNRVWPDSDRIDVLTSEDGLPHDAVESLLFDEDGYLWTGTGQGLAMLDRDWTTLRVFRRGAGLRSEVFHANSALRTSDGRLWFGGPGGLTVIDPSKLPPPSPRPPIALTTFSIFGEEQPEERWYDLDGPLVLQPDENFFSFDFAALDFVDPEYNRYRYRLEGLEEDWVDGGNEGRANYTSVPPDDYVFVVSAANSEGVWNERGLEIPIRVLPPFYETWWFRLLVALAVLGLLAALYAYRMHQLARELARVSAMRVRIAGRLHNEIGANLASIRARSAARARSRGSAPTEDAVGRLAEDTIRKVREMLWVVKEEHDTVAGLVGQIENATDSLLAGVVPYDFRAAPPPDPSRAVPMELREDLYSLVYEALQNVVKHAEAEHVEVSVAFERDELVVTVSDDGVGFDPEGVQASEGLAQLRRSFDNRRLRASVESGRDRGTKVTIRVRV
jgi:signal transduction histidine kinase/streptogramin lyase